MSVSIRTRDRYRGSSLKRAVDRIAHASDFEPGTVLVPGTKVRENRQGAGVMTVSEQRENLVWVKERAGPYHITKLAAADRITRDAREGQRVKILGGMREFVGKTGTIQYKEGNMYRVKLDSPVDIPNVGKVDNDLWEGGLLKKIGDG